MNNSGSTKISILNKISHKPLLFDTLFSFVETRPFLYPFLIDNDHYLKKNLKNSIQPINKKNKLSTNINNNIYKFICYRLLYETEICFEEKDTYKQLIKYNLDNTFFLEQKNDFAIKYYSDILIKKIKNNDATYKLNIKQSKIIHYLPEDKNLFNFTKDYIFFLKEVFLFHLPLTKGKSGDENISEDDMYIDSSYIYMLNKKKYTNINQKINLICTLEEYDNQYYKNVMSIEYDYVNKIYFILKDYKCKNLFQKVYLYLTHIKNKAYINEINFDDSFSVIINDKLCKKNLYLNCLVEDYFITKKKEEGKFDLNFPSLKRIEFNDEKIENNIDKFLLRYNLNTIFGFNSYCKLITITPKDYDNIFNFSYKEERNLMIKINRDTNLKILFIDFEDNSPFNKKFFTFCEKYLNNSKVNVLIIDNIGNINYDEECYNSIHNFKKVNFHDIAQIYYEKDIINNHLNNILKENNNNIELNDDKEVNNNKIKDIIKSFFVYDKFMLYEGYDNNNNLIYFNIIKKINENEIINLFNENQKICRFNLCYENIEIKYDKNTKHLSIINNDTMGESYIYYTPIKFFSKFIKSFENIEELTIDGFNFNFSEIYNKNITSLNINILKNYSINNCYFMNELNDNIFIYKKLKILKISGDYDTLQEITKNIPPDINLKSITFYSIDGDEKKLSNIKNKLNKKNIVLEVIQISKTGYGKRKFQTNKKKQENIININNNNFKIEKDEEDKIYNNVSQNDSRFPIDSKILKDNRQFNILKKGFYSLYGGKKIKDLIFKLVYRATRDGGTINNFKKICKSEIQTLLIIETDKGKIFGAYAHFKDKNTNNNKYNNQFIFDITNDKFEHKDINGIMLGVENYFSLYENFLNSYGRNKIGNERFSCKEVEAFLVKVNLYN